MEGFELCGQTHDLSFRLSGSQPSSTFGGCGRLSVDNASSGKESGGRAVAGSPWRPGWPCVVEDSRYAELGSAEGRDDGEPVWGVPLRLASRLLGFGGGGGGVSVPRGALDVGGFPVYDEESVECALCGRDRAMSVAVEMRQLLVRRIDLLIDSSCCWKEKL